MPSAPTDRLAARSDNLVGRFRDVRAMTERLCEPLAVEDYVVQSMPDVSPTKWHLAHVTWFFETFVLKPHVPGYRPPHPEFEYLFNSYYNTIGAQYPRPRRGLLTRPTVRQVFDYRAHVDKAVSGLLAADPTEDLLRLVEIGLHHEQQHQELMLMDIKHVLFANPLYPAYRPAGPEWTTAPAAELAWVEGAAGEVEIGHAGAGFAFDNERPRHRRLLEPFRLASRMVTNAEYLEFVEAGGYRRPEHWLSDGWAAVREREWEAPLYWLRRDGAWHEYTLRGLGELEPHLPVAHVSYYEADAFARWAGRRLPGEAEWEVLAARQPVEGNFLENDRLHPAPALGEGEGPRQLFGELWEWTQSPYTPYPGYRPEAGALGEYNGKFMCNQLVLRGGACVTPREHVRASYRNFFYPHQRWQFSGIRLAS